jgi:hypothetical protein
VGSCRSPSAASGGVLPLVAFGERLCCAKSRRAACLSLSCGSTIRRRRCGGGSWRSHGEATRGPARPHETVLRRPPIDRFQPRLRPAPRARARPAVLLLVLAHVRVPRASCSFSSLVEREGGESVAWETRRTVNRTVRKHPHERAASKCSRHSGYLRCPRRFSVVSRGIEGLPPDWSGENEERHGPSGARGGRERSNFRSTERQSGKSDSQSGKSDSKSGAFVSPTRRSRRKSRSVDGKGVGADWK